MKNLVEMTNATLKFVNISNIWGKMIAVEKN